MTILEPGQSFGHYTIVSQSASDEGGALYRAYDSAAASDVLLRVLPASLSQEAGFDARFQALGAALRKLSHPNILRVLETGIVDGSPYWSMPLVDAAPLSERLASGQIAPAQSDRLLGQIAGALQYAHESGVAHGALTPAHVLVDSAGNALLTDFGLASLQSAAAAPDPRADLAALGALLPSVLTGKTSPDSAAVSDAFGRLTAILPADRRQAAAAAYASVMAQLAGGTAAGFGSVRDFLAAWQAASRATVGGAPSAGMSAPSSTPSSSAGPGAPSGSASSAAGLSPSSRTPPPVPPPTTRPPATGVPTSPPASAAALLAAARELEQQTARAKALAEQQAQARIKAAADQSAKALADVQAKAFADQQAVIAAAQSRTVASDTEFAKAQARDAAARGAGVKGSVRDGVRASLEITQRLARSTTDPARRAALEQIVADIQKIGDQRASGDLSDEAAHAAISDLVRQVRQLESQAVPAGRAAAQGAAAAALTGAAAAARADIPAVTKAVRQQASAVARPAVSRARPVIFGSIGLIMVVCVGLMIVCAVAVSALPDATPTPGARAVGTGSLTRAAPVPTLRAPVVLSTPRAGASARAAGPTPTVAPLRTSVVFTDTFATGSCNLVEGDSSLRTLKCDHNEYVMLVKPSDSRWVYYDAPPEYQNTVIDFDTRAISSSPAMEYGVVWRVASDGQSFYGFTLKPTGEMAVFIYKDSDFSYLLEGVTAGHFRTGGGLNHVTITANGPDLSFALNGEPLPFTLSDTTLTSGTIGFIINSSAPNAQAAFSNLVVSEIQ